MFPSHAEVAAAEATAIAQRNAIDAAYRRAKLPGRPPKHWLGKLARLNKSGNLPVEWKHLRTADCSLSRALADSLDAGAQEYRADQQWVAGKRGQRVLDRKGTDAKVRTSHAGKASGVERRDAAMADLCVVVSKYRSAHSGVGTKPHALTVARWWVSQPAQSEGLFRPRKNLRSLAQCLRNFGLAT